MKILLLSTHDSLGAGKVMVDLSNELINQGHDVLLLVKEKKTNSIFIKEYQLSFKEKMNLKLTSFNKKTHDSNPNYYYFENQFMPYISDHKNLFTQISFSPDKIIVGWISNFINYENLYQLKKNYNSNFYIWTTDFAPFTGGCHYFNDCIGYQTDCSNCPALFVNKNIAKKNLIAKKNYINKINPTLLICNTQLEQVASQSTLYSNKKRFLFHGLINQNIFNTKNRKYSKEILGINNSKKTILLAATNITEKRKGAHLVLEALSNLNEFDKQILKDNFIFIVVGKINSDILSNFNYIELDYTTDERYLSIIYQSADFYFSFSTQDAGPMMLLQAMACGSIVCSFDIGFSYDFINNNNGYKSNVFTSTSIIEIIKKIILLTTDDVLLIQKNIASICNKIIKKNLNTLHIIIHE